MIRKVKPKFRRNDPEQLALVEELGGYSDEQIKELEVAIENFIHVGSVDPLLETLMSRNASHMQEAA
ncbi:MAG: hypothetical protein KJN60_05640 [Boseongicola sp.]|nr:hypothetical protein [Boseongicola sp.]